MLSVLNVQANGPRPAPNPASAKIQKAADVGKKAWMPGAASQGPEKVHLWTL